MTGPGKRALVTGAGSGIGAACADVLESRGWQLIRTDLKPAGGVRSLDVTDESAWDELMAEERLREPAQVAWLTGRVPLGRIGEPVEIGELAEFLLSERASYISGEVVYADGGWAANAM